MTEKLYPRPDLKIKQTKTLEDEVRPEKTLSMGTILDKRYEIQEFLGAGGMGQVYRAKHLVFDEDCALKVLHYDGQNDTIAKNRFFYEVRTLKRICSEFVLEIADAGVSLEGAYYTVFELLEGETLDAWMRKTPLVKRDGEYIKRVMGYMHGVCLGLKAAHEQGVIHRDLKPANIYLAESKIGKTPKIIDFGLARPIVDQSDQRRFAGSPAYAAPEQIECKTLDERTDIYALGAILYEALAARTPQGDDVDPALQRSSRASLTLKPPSEYNPSVPPELDRVVLKALEHDPRNRYQSVDQLLAGLQFATGEDEEGGEVVTRDRRRSWIPALLVGLALLAGLLAGYMMGQVTGKVAGEVTREVTGEVSPPVAVPVIPPVKSLAVAASSIEPAVPERDLEPVQSAQKEIVVSSPRATKETPEPPEEEAPSEQPVKDLLSAAIQALEQANYTEAESLFEDVLKLDNKSAAAWHGLGKISFESRKYDLAISRWNTALRHRSDPVWRVELGSAYVKTGQAEQAAAEWTKVLDSNNASAKRLAQKYLEELEN